MIAYFGQRLGDGLGAMEYPALLRTLAIYGGKGETSKRSFFGQDAVDDADHNSGYDAD